MTAYKYRVTGPRGGKYLTTTRKEAEALTKNGGSFRALGQKKASKVKNPGVTILWGGGGQGFIKGEIPGSHDLFTIEKANISAPWVLRFYEDGQSPGRVLDYGNNAGKLKKTAQRYVHNVADYTTLGKYHRKPRRKVKNPARDGQYSDMNPKIQFTVEGSSRVMSTKWFSTIKAAKASLKRKYLGKKIEAWIADDSERGSGGRRRNPRGGFSDYYASRGDDYIIEGDVVKFRYHDIPYTVVSPNNVLDYVNGGYDENLYDVTLAMFAPKVLVFNHGIEDAIEEAAGWAADHAPGVFNDDEIVQEAEAEGWMDDLFYTESGYLTGHEMHLSEVHDPGLIAEAIGAAAHWYKETWDMDEEDWRKVGRTIKKFRSKELRSRK